MDEKLQMVIHTLNMVEVHGADNLSRLLGCIEALEEIEKEVNDGRQEHPGTPAGV